MVLTERRFWMTASAAQHFGLSTRQFLRYTKEIGLCPRIKGRKPFLFGAADMAKIERALSVRPERKKKTR